MVLLAVTGGVIIGTMSVVLLQKNGINAFPSNRMGILGGSILGAAIPLVIAGICTQGD